MGGISQLENYPSYENKSFVYSPEGLVAVNVVVEGITGEDVVSAVEISLSNGFTPDVDLIFGFPGETIEDMEKTLNLARKLVNMGARIHLHYYIPLPGTPFGMKKPTRIPEWIKKEIWKMIGMGRGYGDWIKQEELSWRIIELHEKGVIAPKWSKAPGVIT